MWQINKLKNKFNILFWEKTVKNCEECEIEVKTLSDHNLCDECEAYHYCECGTKLEDSAGTPGDGFCRQCD